MSYTANEEWLRNLQYVTTKGSLVNPRGKETREVLGNRSVVDMRFPCVTIRQRKMGFRFLAAEAHWILSGDNRLETIAPYAKHIKNFSDDGYRFQGAYGPRVSEQLRFVCDTLAEDPSSRQAVINIWRENPRQSKDIPCTLSLQFLIRDGEINCVATMRSSDLWLGWVYDVFNFTMIASWVALRLREMSPTLTPQLGLLYLTAGSQHVYSINHSDVLHVLNCGDAWSYSPMDLTIFNGPVSLMQHLVALRDKDWPTVGSKFFYELKDQVPGTA